MRFVEGSGKIQRGYLAGNIRSRSPGQGMGALWEHSHGIFEVFWGRNRYGQVKTQFRLRFCYY